MALTDAEMKSLMADDDSVESKEEPKVAIVVPEEEEDEEESGPPLQLTPDNVRTIGGLPIHKAGDQVHKHLKLLIYAEPGAGKTYLIGSASKVAEMSPVLLLDVDGGELTLTKPFPDVEIVRIRNWKDMQSLYADLRKGDFPYKTIGVDSLTELQKFNMDQIMNVVVKADKDRDRDKPGWDEFAKNGGQTRRVVRLLRDLPVHVVFTCHVQEKRNKEGQVVGRMPDLTGKLARQVPGFIDTVGFLYTKIIGGEVVRLMQTFNDNRTAAKDRSGNLDKIVKKPSMQTIHDAYFA